MPIKEVTTAVRARAKELGARKVEVCIDCVAYAPHRRVDVRDWDVDYCFFSVSVLCQGLAMSFCTVYLSCVILILIAPLKGQNELINKNRKEQRKNINILVSSSQSFDGHRLSH